MRISLVMSVFNAEKYINTALSSVYNQTRKIDEIIIVDDGSYDKTNAIIRNWIKLLPIKLFKNKSNMGIAFSLNTAIKKCTTEWFLRLDADDYWKKDHIKNFVKCLSTNISRNLVLITSQTETIFSNNSFTKKANLSVIAPDKIRFLLMWNNPITHSAVAINLEAFNLVGGYNLHERWEDYDLWVRLVSIGKLHVIDKITCCYTVNSNSISRIDSSKAYKARWRIQKKAIKKFFWSHPLFSIAFLIIGTLRSVCVKIK